MNRIIALLFAPVLLSSISFTVSPAFADTDSNLCLRRKAVSGKIRLNREIRSVTGACPTGFVKVLDATKNQDGAGSGLDADLLDGISSEQFAAVSELTSLSGTVNSLNTSVSTLTDTVTEVSSTVNAANIVTVASSGGNFSSLSAALASITDSSSTNRYVVRVGPGTFTVDSTLNIPSGVHIQGSGKYSTTLSGDVGTSTASSAANALILVSDGAQLSDLTVENTSSADNSYGVAAVGISETDTTTPALFDTRLTDIRVRLTAATSGRHYGVYVQAADIAISGIEIYVTGATLQNQGVSISNAASYVYLERASIRADNDDAGDIGISMNFGTLEMSNSDVYGYTTGISVIGGILHATYSTAQAQTTSLNITRNGSDNEVRFLHGRIIADGVSGIGVRVSGTPTTTLISQSEIAADDNFVSASSGAASCTAISTDGASFFASSCE